ncbi:MAG: FHA domain-containing protein [Clostridia bacterium]|nr:FHA domain-containing protein [Clostridia bacterium]
MSKFKALFSRGGGVQCAFCGTELENGDLFCPNCGQARPDEGIVTPEPEIVPMAAGLVCHACGNPMEEGDRFCMNCGAKREDIPAAAEENDVDMAIGYSLKWLLPEESRPAAEPEMPMGFKEAAAFEDEKPFIEEEFTPAPVRKPAHLRIEKPEAEALEPATAVFMTEDEPAEAEEIAEAEAEEVIEVADESAIWGRPAAEEAPAVNEEEVIKEDAAPAEPETPAEPVPTAQTFLIDGEEPAPAQPEPETRPAATAPSMYGLRFIAEPDREISVLRSGAMIGRLSTCSLVLDEPSISRRHCHIDSIDGQWKIVVLGVNGIVIDGEHYSNEYGRPIPLTDGCIIEFPGIHGNTAVQFLASPFGE